MTNVMCPHDKPGEYTLESMKLFNEMLMAMVVVILKMNLEGLEQRHLFPQGPPRGKLYLRPRIKVGSCDARPPVQNFWKLGAVLQLHEAVPRDRERSSMELIGRLRAQSGQ